MKALSNNALSTSLEGLIRHPVVAAVRAMAEATGLTLYLVGGCVRDYLITGKVSDDLDFVIVRAHQTDALQTDPSGQLSGAEPLARALADRYHGALVPLDPEFGIYRTVLHANLEMNGYVLPGRIYLDISNALENDIEKDLARRDLSINAMAVDLQAGQLIDPHGGLTDLQQNRIRVFQKSNLSDDPLRLLRVFRMTAKLAKIKSQPMSIDPKTLHLVRELKALIHQPAAERVQYELYKMASTGHSFPAWQAMAECGLLEELFPEFSPMRDIPPNGHHHLGLFDHTLELVRQAERLVLTLSETDQQHFAQPFRNSEITHLGIVVLACLFHDLGKPATKGEKITANGSIRLTYYGHEQVSEELTDAICKRLKTSVPVREQLKTLVRWHLYPCQFGPDSPRKSVLRFFRRIGEATPDLLLLALADRFSTLGPDITESILATSDQNHRWLLEQYRAEQSVLRMPRLLNGGDVMALLNLPPGPHLKQLLSALEEAQQLGEVQTREQAQAWLKEHHQTILQQAESSTS